MICVLQRTFKGASNGRQCKRERECFFEEIVSCKRLSFPIW